MTQIESKRWWPADSAQEIFGATASGILSSFTFDGTLDHVLAVVALVPLFVVLAGEGLSLARSFFLGLWCGAIGFGMACHWLPDAFALYTSAGVNWGLFVWSITCTIQALVFAFLALLVRWLYTNGMPLVISSAAAVVVVEWLAPRPLNHHIGDAAHGAPIIAQLASLGGPLLLSALFVATNAAIARGLSLRKWPSRAVVPLGGLALVWSAVVVFGLVNLSRISDEVDRSPSIIVAAVQESIAAEEKHAAPQQEVARHLATSRPLADDAHADLIIWPETVIPFRIDNRAEDLGDSLLGGGVGAPLLFGGHQLYAGTSGATIKNSAFLVDGEGKRLGAYDKKILFPLAEALPFASTLKKLGPKGLTLPELSEGKTSGVMEAGRIRVGAMICYEDIFSTAARDLVGEGANLLVSLSNDAWFGRTIAATQHYALARLRAVETRRSFVRSGNTGITVAVGPDGRELGSIPQFERRQLVTTVPLLTSTTIYSYIGDWPAWLGLVILVLSLARHLHRRRDAST